MRDNDTCTAPALALPAELAPALVQRIELLLAEVRPTQAPELVIDLRHADRAPRCVVCHQSGKLGGHHGPDGQVQWIHRSCHRRLHLSGRHQVSLVPAQPRRRTAC